MKLIEQAPWMADLKELEFAAEHYGLQKGAIRQLLSDTSVEIRTILDLGSPPEIYAIASGQLKEIGIQLQFKSPAKQALFRGNGKLSDKWKNEIKFAIIHEFCHIMQSASSNVDLLRAAIIASQVDFRTPYPINAAELVPNAAVLKYSQRTIGYEETFKAFWNRFFLKRYDTRGAKVNKQQAIEMCRAMVEFTPTTVDYELWEKIKNLSQNPDTDLLDPLRGEWIGWWISPEMKVYRLPKNVIHNTFIYKQFHLSYDDALKRGWAAVRIEDYDYSISASSMRYYHFVKNRMNVSARIATLELTSTLFRKVDKLLEESGLFPKSVDVHWGGFFGKHAIADMKEFGSLVSWYCSSDIQRQLAMKDDPTQ